MLTLSGTTSLANYQTALESITFSTTAATGGARTIDWVVKDGSTSNGTSTTATSTVEVVAGPQISVGTDNSVNYDENGAAVAVDSGLTLTDPAGANITSATVTISSGYVSGDLLAIPAGDISGGKFESTNITVTSFNTTTDQLVLSGTDTAANYQAALDAITYSFTANPTTAGTSRTLTYSATDANSTTSAAGVTSTVELIHVAPVVTAGTPSVTFDGGSTTPVVLDSGITVADSDSGGTLASATVSISSGYITGDTLNFTNNSSTMGNIAISTNSGGQLVLTSAGDTATLAQWDAALQSVSYSFTPSGDDPTGGSANDTSRTISWVVNDGSTSNGTSNTPTTTLSVVHEAPVVTAGTPSVTFDGGSTTPVVLDSGITVADSDSGGTLASATVSISSGYITGDTLNFTNNSSTMGNIAISTNSGGQLVLTSAGDTATLAQWDAALQSVSYSFTPSGDDPTGGSANDTSRTISWVVNDGSTSNGTSNTATSTLDTAHVAPVVTAGGTATFDGGGSAVALDGTLTVSDPDSGGNLTGATVTIGTGNISGDTLTINGTTSGTLDSGAISYAFTGSSLTLTGTATVAEYQAALRLVNYSFTSGGDPTNGGSDTSRGITWQVTDEANATASDTSTLSVMHEPPVVTANNPSVTFDGGGSAVPLDTGLTVSDPDSGGNLTGATVTIGTGNISGDTLTINGTTSGTLDSGAISYAFTGSSLTLTGTATVAEYQAALRLVNYSFTSGGDPTNGGSDTSRGITWQVTDEANATASDTSTLSVMHEPPVVTANNPSVTFDGGGSAVPLDTGLTVSDPDSGGNLTGATVTIGTGNISGDTLTINGTTSGTLDSGAISYAFTGSSLTLTGTATVAEYRAALRLVNYSFTSGGDPTNGGSDTSRGITWQVTDEANATASDTSTLSVMHEPPTVSAGATATFETGSATAVVLDSGLTVSDPDSGGNLTGATVTIGTGYVSGDDTLTINGTTRTAH